MPNQTKTPSANTVSRVPKVHHRIRTVLAALFGILAVVLILSSLVSVWLNRTLTDTPTYVAAVAPLATKPDIQSFVAQKISDELVKNAPTQELANALLSPSQIAGQTPQQLKILLQPVVYNTVLTTVRSPSFAELWKNTNQTAHAQLTSQLNSNSSIVSLDLTPVLVSVTDQLRTTPLGDIGSQAKISPNAGKVNLQGSGIYQARTTYQRFKQSTILVIILTLVAIALSVIISVHHIKTIRRILMGSGIICLFLAASIQLPLLITVKGSDLTTQKAAAVMIQTIFRNLQLASLVLGFVLVSAALASKIFDVVRAKSAKT